VAHLTKDLVHLLPESWIDLHADSFTQLADMLVPA